MIAFFKSLLSFFFKKEKTKSIYDGHMVGNYPIKGFKVKDND